VAGGRRARHTARRAADLRATGVSSRTEERRSPGPRAEAGRNPRFERRRTQRPSERLRQLGILDASARGCHRGSGGAAERLDVWWERAVLPMMSSRRPAPAHAPARPDEVWHAPAVGRSTRRKEPAAHAGPPAASPRLARAPGAEGITRMRSAGQPGESDLLGETRVSQHKRARRADRRVSVRRRISRANHSGRAKKARRDGQRDGTGEPQGAMMPARRTRPAVWRRCRRQRHCSHQVPPPPGTTRMIAPSLGFEIDGGRQRRRSITRIRGGAPRPPVPRQPAARRDSARRRSRAPVNSRVSTPILMRAVPGAGRRPRNPGERCA
jgi:hypothetical protein